MAEGPHLMFWFDPVCPFTFKTAQWIRNAGTRDGGTVTWRVMSLAILNAGREIPEQFREGMRQAPRAHRLLVAVDQRHGQAAVDALYRAIGERLHGKGETLGSALLAEALADADLPAALIAAADDSELDASVRASHDEGQARVGTESGTPITAIGSGPGFFGPIVAEVPDARAGEQLLEAVRLLAGVPQFSELKRARDVWSAPPEA